MLPEHLGIVVSFIVMMSMVRVPVGKGNVVITGFRPQFRGQPGGTFKLTPAAPAAPAAATNKPAAAAPATNTPSAAPTAAAAPAPAEEAAPAEGAPAAEGEAPAES